MIRVLVNSALVGLLIAGSWLVVTHNSTPTPPTLPSNTAPANSLNTVSSTEQVESHRYFIDIAVQDEQQLKTLFDHAKQVHLAQPTPNEQPIVLVLHGPETLSFDLKHYEQHQQIIDLAAQLDAFNIIDIKMCSAAIGHYNLTPEQIPPFIELVPLAEQEIQRLQQQGYQSLL